MEKVPVTKRRPKWQYQHAQPTPRILQLPSSSCSSRPRKNYHKSNISNGKVMMMMMMRKVNKLGVLFDEEREFRRGRVDDRVDGVGAEEVEEEKWRFQAEMLRAECNLLRIEREVAIKKMERRRVQVERLLRSAVQSLLSGRNKICDGENVIMVLEEEIKNLTEKLEKLQRRSGVKYLEVKSSGNFDKQACLLQRRLVKVGATSDETCVKEIREMAEASLSINKTSCRVDDPSFVSNENCHMEILRRKMEGLSQGILLERINEEYGPMLLSTANTSASSSASTSKRTEAPDVSSSPKRHPYKAANHEEKLCSGKCRAVMRRIVEQVRVETEQWSQMQEMLGQVRDEMEELQASRDFWEDRALDSDYQIQSLLTAVQEWKQKAISSETKANELQAQVTLLRKEIEWLKQEQAAEASRAKASPSPSADAQNETEKRVLVCHLKENHRANDSSTKRREVLLDGRRKANMSSSRFVTQKRSPLRDIGNLSSPLVRQSSKAVVYPLHSNVDKNFGREKVCK
ncbi:hypothetical protein AB3S75_007563 [Citrus x aurantiifolia]